MQQFELKKMNLQEEKFLLPALKIQSNTRIPEIIGPLFNTDTIEDVDHDDDFHKNQSSPKKHLLIDIDDTPQSFTEHTEITQSNFKKTISNQDPSDSFFVENSIILSFLRIITLWLIQIALQFYRPLPKKNDPNEARVAMRNNQTQITFDTVNWLSIRKTLNWNEKTIDVGTFSYAQNGFVIGASNTWWVHVPMGMFAKVKINYQPVLLTAGHHVIHGILELNGQTPRAGVHLNNNYYATTDNRIGDGALVPQRAHYIKNQTLHIIQVPNGCACFVSINNQLYFLTHQSKPYIFDSSKFSEFSLKKIKGNKDIQIEPRDSKQPYIYQYPGIDFMALANTKTIEFSNFGYYMPSPNEDIVVFHGSEPVLCNNEKRMKQHEAQPIIIDRNHISRVERVERHVKKCLRVPQDKGDIKATERVLLQGNIPINIKTDIFYEIKDSIALLKKFSNVKNFEKILSDKVLVCMGNKLSQESIEDLIRTAHFSDKIDEQVEGIRTKVGSCVLKELQKEFMEYGVEITLVGLVEYNFADKKFGQDLENQTKKVQATKRQLDSIVVENNIQKTRNEIDLSIAKTQADKKLIDAKATAEAQRIKYQPELEYLDKKSELLKGSPQLFQINLAQTYCQQPIVVSGVTGSIETIPRPTTQLPNLFTRSAPCATKKEEISPNAITISKK
jgi:hypothetical protein